MPRSWLPALWLAGAITVLAAGPEGSPPRGYTLPLIDLANETERQVVVDREPGQYLGHPTTVLLEDNKTMIVVYPKGHGRGGIVMKGSTDGGRTWSERLAVPDNWSTSKEVPTIHRVIDPKGVKRLIMFSGLYPIRTAVSEDDGLTWSPLEPIGDFGGIVAMGDVERLRDGRYMALFHDDGRYFKNEQARGAFTVFKTLPQPDGFGSRSLIRVTAYCGRTRSEAGGTGLPQASGSACDYTFPRRACDQVADLRVGRRSGGN